ncbi:MAG: hypothetical protein ACR2N5_06455, partial [Solirubrobacterales bacterium]
DDSADLDSAGEQGGSSPNRRRRRRRRGGRGGRGGGKSSALQASFDHGEQDGIGLWLDPAVKENSIYEEHWAGHRAVEVSIEPDRITIKRSNGDSAS